MINRLLDEEEQRDYLPSDHERSGRIYLIAHPITGRHDQALAFVRGDAADLQRRVSGLDANIPAVVRHDPPNLTHAQSPKRRSKGTSLVSYVAGGPGRTPDERYQSSGGEDLLDVELREDGGVRILASHEVITQVMRGDTLTYVADGLAAAWTLRLALIAALLAGESGYRGSWLLGIRMTKIRGLTSSSFYNSSGQRATYDAEKFQEWTTASTIEVAASPGQVAARLTARLHRALGSEEQFVQAYESATSAGN